MTQRMKVRPALPLLLAVACATPMPAQQLIGYVNTRDADITGATDVLDGQAVLTDSVSVTAKDHTAPITLGRGGTVRVCQTSELHVTEDRAVTIAAPLLFSLDRGAIEIQTMGTASDAIMTPDLRFTVRSNGPLDLRMRVARNGDTCVENRGPGAPTLAVSDPFGEAMYEVAPGQHMLFEHGSLHEVVDHESSPCGCPDAKGMSIADALLASGGPKPAAPAPVQTPPPVPVQVPAPTPVQTPPQVAQAPPPVQAPTPTPVVKAPVQVAAASPPVRVPAPTPVQGPVHVAPAPPPVQASVQVTQMPPPVKVAPPVPVQVAPTPAPVKASVPPPLPAPDPAAELAAAQAAEQAAEQAAAQSAIQAAERTATQTPAQAAERHPFPAAISEGLAPTAEIPQAAPGQVHAQVTDSLSYSAPTDLAAPAPAAAKPPAAPPPPAAKPPAPPPNDLAHVIARFFRKLFGL